MGEEVIFVLVKKLDVIDVGGNIFKVGDIVTVKVNAPLEGNTSKTFTGRIKSFTSSILDLDTSKQYNSCIESIHLDNINYFSRFDIKDVMRTSVSSDKTFF
jgi:hypothetical protein